jgi:hypothetical protein
MKEKDEDIAHPGMVSKEKHLILALNRPKYERRLILL